MADQSTLSWLFNLDDRMSSPAEKIATNLDRVGKSLERTEERTARTEQQLDKLHRSAKNIESISVFELMAHGAETLLGIVERVVDKIIEVGGEMIKTAAENEQLEKSFELLMGPDLGHQTLDYLDELSKHLNMTDDDAKKMGRSLLAVGFGVEELPRALAAVSDMGAIMGGGAQGMQEALSAIERIKRTGIIENRSLGALGISQGDIFSRMSANTGQTPEALKKLMESGKLDPDQALKAIYQSISAKTGKVLGEGGLEMGQTLAARLEKLKDLPSQFFQDLSHSEGFAEFSKTIQLVVDKLSPDSPAGRKIMAGLTMLTDRFAKFLSGMDWDKVIGKLITWLDLLPGRIAALSDWFDRIWPTVVGLAEGIAFLTRIFYEWYHLIVDAVSTGCERFGVILQWLFGPGGPVQTGIDKTKALSDEWNRLQNIVNKIPHVAAARYLVSLSGGETAAAGAEVPAAMPSALAPEASVTPSAVLRGPMMGGLGQSMRPINTTVGDVIVNLPPGTSTEQAKDVAHEVHHTVGDALERAHASAG